MPGSRAQPLEPIQIGALHHPFFIDVGAQKTGAVRLQLPNYILSGEVGGFLPAVRYDLAALRIERDDQPVGPYGICNYGELFPIERRRADNHAISALFNQSAGSLGRPNAAAHTRYRSRSN